MREIVSGLFLIIFFYNPEFSAAQRTCTIGLGESKVKVVESGPKDAPVHLLNLHDNENTSVEAAMEVIENKGGRLVELRHSGERLITFSAQGRTYQCDPNRIFTPEGRRATLSRYGTSGIAAEKALAAFADSLLEVYGITNVPCIVTLHNNTDNDFSAKSYLPGAIYEKEARKVFLAPGSDADDFVMVTRGRFYRFYKRKGINVVLQSKRPSDDGSLSVYAELNQLPYINIEAQSGHLTRQVTMIEATYQLLEQPEGFFSWFGKLFRKKSGRSK